jgi:2-polyprenyl-3-methyl-5-hydroxy-6-metoxy-1,4-benzoquinol methylase
MSNKNSNPFGDPLDLKALIHQYASEPIPPWEEHYLEIHKTRYRDTLDLLGPGDGQRLLDVGAFPGHLSIAAHHLGFQVSGLTGKAESTTCLNLIEERFSRHRIPIAMADVESDPFPYADEFFDVVLASEIIEHLNYNPYRLLREAFRVLKPGGFILLSTPNLSRLDNRVRRWDGRSIHSEIKGRFYESFSSILSARHIREYTAMELSYMLEGQNKEMYRFEDTQVHFSACSEPAYAWPRLAEAIKRFWPKFRSTLLVKAFRPKRMKLIHPEEVEAVSGLYPVEEHSPDMEGIARILTTPFRWTEGKAELSLPASDAPYQVFFLNLVYLVPESLPPALWTVSLEGKAVTCFGLPPDRMFTQILLALPGDLAQKGEFQISLSGSVWKPEDHPVANDYEFSLNDSRNLGLVVAWDGFLRQDCDSREDLLKRARKEIRLFEQYRSFDLMVNWRRLHHCFDDRWSPLQSLYLLQAEFKSTLSMGNEDWRQLGPGWYFLENWAVGPVRWTSRRAEAYLGTKPGQKHLRLRVFSGESFLGYSVSGTLTLSYSQDRLAFVPLTETTFDLPAGLWTDLVAHFPHKIANPGLIHLVIQTDQSRYPARLIPGSTDTRELGLAVMGLALS